LTLAQADPSHRQRRQVPARCARNAERLVVVYLMARAAPHRRHATTVDATLHVHEMCVAIIALRRPVAARMAVNATQALQHWCYGLEQRAGVGCAALRHTLI